MITAKQKLHRKIALRFLKETGLYKAWFDYIKSPIGKDFIGEKKWYDHEYVISIFGATRFTDYLAAKCGIKLNSAIYKYFRTYVELYYSDSFDGENMIRHLIVLKIYQYHKQSYSISSHN